MSKSAGKENATPLELTSPVLADYPELLELAACWQSCRGDKMVPSKHDFEGAILGHPVLLPNMTMIELTSDGSLNYLYIGSDRAARRNEEDTGQTVNQSLAPAAGELIMLYAISAFEKPFAMFWAQGNKLPSGAVAKDHSLGVVLADENGKANAIAIASVIDPVYEQEIERGGYMIGSEGVDVTPIDIGLGIPNLPRSAGAS